MSRSPSAVRAYWLGRIGYLECWDLQRSLVEGLESAPRALIGILAGDNVGKRMVRVGADPVT